MSRMWDTYFKYKNKNLTKKSKRTMTIKFQFSDFQIMSHRWEIVKYTVSKNKKNSLEKKGSPTYKISNQSDKNLFFCFLF